jgi:phage baseplate assembly protein W
MATRGTNIGFSTFNKKRPPFTLENLDLAKQDLLYSFHTRLGERVMRPDFGSIIFDLLFEPFDDDTRQAVVDDAIRLIGQDPRFAMVSIDVHELEHTLRLDLRLRYIPLDVVESLAIEYDRQNIEAQ